MHKVWRAIPRTDKKRYVIHGVLGLSNNNNFISLFHLDLVGAECLRVVFGTRSKIVSMSSNRLLMRYPSFEKINDSGKNSLESNSRRQRLP